MTDDFRAQLALLVVCNFCDAQPGEKCDIEGKRAICGDPPHPTWLPYWERGVHKLRAEEASKRYAELPPLQVAMLLAMAKADAND